MFITIMPSFNHQSIKWTILLITVWCSTIQSVQQYQSTTCEATNQGSKTPILCGEGESCVSYYKNASDSDSSTQVTECLPTSSACANTRGWQTRVNSEKTSEGSKQRTEKCSQSPIQPADKNLPVSLYCCCEGYCFEHSKLDSGVEVRNSKNASKSSTILSETTSESTFSPATVTKFATNSISGIKVTTENKEAGRKSNVKKSDSIIPIEALYIAIIVLVVSCFALVAALCFVTIKFHKLSKKHHKQPEKDPKSQASAGILSPQIVDEQKHEERTHKTDQEEPPRTETSALFSENLYHDPEQEGKSLSK